MKNIDSEVRLIECAYCGKTIKIECPDINKNPADVKTLKKNERFFSSLAHRKMQVACSNCYKISDVYWLYSYS